MKSFWIYQVQTFSKIKSSKLSRTSTNCLPINRVLNMGVKVLLNLWSTPKIILRRKREKRRSKPSSCLSFCSTSLQRNKQDFQKNLKRSRMKNRNNKKRRKSTKKRKGKELRKRSGSKAIQIVVWWSSFTSMTPIWARPTKTIWFS